MACSSRSEVTTIRVSRGAQGVQLRADLDGLGEQVAGVQPHGAQLGSGDVDRDLDRRRHVVGVDQQGRALAQAGDLRLERGALGVVQQGERVRARAGGRHAVRAPRLEVAGGREPGHVGRAGGGDRRLLVGTARAHLQAGAVAGGGDHPRGGRGDRRVVVEDREDQRLQQHALGEGGLHHEERRAGEEALALGVAGDVAGEAVAGQEVQRLLVDHAALAQRGELVRRRSGSRGRPRAGGRCRPRRRTGGPRAGGGRRPRRRSAAARRRCAARPAAWSARSGRSAGRCSSRCSSPAQPMVDPCRSPRWSSRASS